MIRYLELPREERGEYVREAAARLGIQPVIIEKDLWVCWILGRTFSMPEATSRLVFKGGTSLSKVFGAIQRFSEDIDLGVSPQTLGWNESKLEGASSRNQRDMRMDHLENDCARWVDSTLRPELEAVIREGLGLPETSSFWLEFVRDPATKAPVLNFTYPSVLPPETGYISPWVKLEFGSLTDQQPRGAHIVRTMLAEALNEGVEQCDANVTALEIERTFWEKATILHTEHHRPGTSAVRDRYARHYSDFAVVPHTTWRPSVSCSVIAATEGASTRATCAATSGRSDVMTSSAALVGGSFGPGFLVSRYGTPGGGGAMAKSTPSRSNSCGPSG
jgi:hypothetical protein